MAKVKSRVGIDIPRLAAKVWEEHRNGQVYTIDIPPAATYAGGENLSRLARTLVCPTLHPARRLG
jgi:hypothetical protein